MSEDLGLLDSLADSINCPFPTPLQYEAIPLILGGDDVLIEIESGKGAEVFGPAVVQIVWELKTFVQNGHRKIQKAHRNKCAMALIIEATNETAEKTFDIIQRCAKVVDIPVVVPLLLVGDMKNEELKTNLKNGVDILVGTPAKLQDLSEEGLLKLFSCRIFVLNDAHLSFKGAHEEVITNVHSKIPKKLWGNRRQTVICSNTLYTPKMEEIAKDLMLFPTWIDMNGRHPLPETAFHVVVRINPELDLIWKKLEHHITTDGVHSADDLDDEKHAKEALSEAVKILRGEYIVRAIDACNMDKAVIICRTHKDCEHLEEYLKHLDEEKYSCVSYVANKEEQQQSEEIDLERFAKNEFKFLICTDEDFEKVTMTGLPFMINTSLPMPTDKHMHLRRVEKIGSLERMGLVINFVATVPEKVWSHGEWCPTKGRDCTNADTWENKGCAVYQSDLTILNHLEDELYIKFYEVDSDMKVPFVEIDGKKYYGDEEERPSIFVNHTAEVSPTHKELSQLESQVQSLYLERHLRDKTFPTPVLPSPVSMTTGDSGGHPMRKRRSGAARRKMMKAKRDLEEGGGGVGVDGESSPSPTSNKRFRSNDDVSVSIAPDKVPTTNKAVKGIRAAICHPDYPTSQLSSDQLVTVQRSIIKAVELVPDDGPQVRFQECSHKSGWLLIVCTDQESYSWLRNTVKDLQILEGLQLKVTQERYLVPKSYMFEAVIPDDVGVPLTSEEVLTRLRKMNRTLETGKWAVLHQEASEGGQKWTFRVNLASMKALESMNNRPYFGFGQVQFERKSKFEHKPKDNPENVAMVKDGISVTESMEVESERSTVEPVESGISTTGLETSAKSEGGICVTELLENKVSAAQPMSGDSSFTEIIENGSSAADPSENGPSAAEQLKNGTSDIERDTSMTAPTENNTSGEALMKSDASVTVSNVDRADTQNSEAVLSEAISLETWILGTDTSDAWN